MKWRKVLRPGLLFLLTGILVSTLLSCDWVQLDLQQSRSYLVEPPELNALWLQENGLSHSGWRWQISYVRSSYQSDAWSWETVETVGPDVRVELKKQESAVLQVFPVFAELQDKLPLPQQELWRPGGAVIMWQEHSGDRIRDQNGAGYSLQASWLDGFRSHVLRRLLEGGFDIRYFNASKLLHYMQKRMEQHAGDYLLNPWDYDSDYLVAEISSLQMNWYDIRERESVNTFGMPAGRWQFFNTIDSAFSCFDPCHIQLHMGKSFMLEMNNLQVWQLQVLPSGEVLAIKL